MSRNVMALIPARAGSQRLPGKNTKHLGGLPLVQWTISAAKGTRIFDKIVISTNDEKVREIARKNGCSVVIEQPDFPQDGTEMLKVVRHCMHMHGCTYNMLLQPTSPFRTTAHIEDAYRQFEQIFPMDSLVSVDPAGQVNGAIYIFTWARIMRWEKQIYDDESFRYEMPKKASLDIDTAGDFAKAESYFSGSVK